MAAGLKALGVLSADLNDNYFWPGAFAHEEEIDEEARQMNYCFTREVLIDLDTPAVAKLTQVHEGTGGRKVSVDAWGSSSATATAAPGQLFSIPS